MDLDLDHDLQTSRSDKKNVLIKFHPNEADREAAAVPPSASVLVNGSFPTWWGDSHSGLCCWVVVEKHQEVFARPH